MKPKPIKKALTVFFLVGRINFNRANNQNSFFKNPKIIYTSEDKYFWP